jgi:hypothetical protein
MLNTSNLKNTLRYGWIAAFTLAVAIPLTACGSGEEDEPLERIIDHAQIFTVANLETAGMKTSKQYDVSDLPGGVDAWYGFIRTDSGPMDIEARFYSSHADAMALGTALADAVSGEDADIEEETTPWTEGYKDRQRMRSGGTADLAAWSGQRGPNYADFIIYGNMVLLCQGDDPEQSIETCHELIAAMGN